MIFRAYCWRTCGSVGIPRTPRSSALRCTTSRIAGYLKRLRKGRRRPSQYGEFSSCSGRSDSKSQGCMANPRITRWTAVGLIGLFVGLAMGATEPEDELKSATVLSFVRHSEWLQDSQAGPITV